MTTLDGKKVLAAHKEKAEMHNHTRKASKTDTDTDTDTDTELTPVGPSCIFYKTGIDEKDRCCVHEELILLLLYMWAETSLLSKRRDGRV